MKTTDEQKLARRIARRNAAFKGASKMKKRVMIANDALRRIEEGKFRIYNGTYAILRAPFGEFDGMPDSVDVRDCLEKSEVMCDCCAKGALLLSGIGYYDNTRATRGTTTITLDSPTGLAAQDKGTLKSLFGERQLDAIEIAFEQWTRHNINISSHQKYGPLEERAYRFGIRYDGPTARLIAILKNIVKNGGRFKP